MGGQPPGLGHGVQGGSGDGAPGLQVHGVQGGVLGAWPPVW